MAVVAAALSTTAAPVMAQSAPSVVVAEGYPDASFAYSADGVAYSDSVPELFATSAKLVPGEDVEEKLWVRNDNAMAVNVSVAAMAPPGAGEAAHAGLTPSPVVTLEPGAAAPLKVRMWLPESADNSSQASSLPIRLQVNAREAAPAVSGELGDTGATGGIWPLSVAALLGGAGAYLGSRKRSRKL
ncbi:hypothetical protein ART_4047 [Arthrobacter sp. PAMC 25486]|nr:hypothetical protein ART_4047 [Arthrobacter sp. PAMC 25486]